MRVSDDLSLPSYIGIEGPGGVSFGGSQQWFPTDLSKKDRTLHRGGCGLIAAADLLLYVCGKEGLPLSSVTGDPRTVFPRERGEYLCYVRSLRKYYPLFPKIGSFNAELPLFLNPALKRAGAKVRLHRILLPAKRKLLRTVRHSLRRGWPAILLITPKTLPFTPLKGVTFYSDEGGCLQKASGPVRAHFVTVTGIRCPVLTGQPLYYEISSWGKKYYIDSEELAEYMRRASLPMTGCLFFLK